ncbi:hypothetical protein CM49_04358 [Paenibacillus sp. P1XP2]|nr:hypothetical protein CM49_04358 [Paenibacillus sp. P1XP2]
MTVVRRYEIGQPFPQDGPGKEIIRSQLNGSSFDVLLWLNNLTSREKKVFKDSLLRLHVLIESYIPFIAVSYLGSAWTYDFTVSVAGRNSAAVDIFLQDGNAVFFYLIDAKTNILHATRMIGLPLEAEKQIKNACCEQYRIYGDQSAEVYRVISQIYSYMPTDKIIQYGTTYEFKRTY